MSNRNYDFGDEYDLDDDSQGVGDDIRATDAAIFGELRGRGDARVVAKATPLSQIWFDLTQPRNLIPAKVRGRWDGNPDGVPELINEWLRMARATLKPDERVAAGAIIRGEDYLDLERDEQAATTRTLLDLLSLAMDIQENGLTNPATVSVVERGRYLLHSGERRVLAHHLLKMAWEGTDTQTKWLKIPVIEQAEHSVWTQITENTQRSEMNAIAMARSLAKLKLDMYAGEVDFAPYHEMIGDGGSDRPFYAQTAELQIKYGMAEQVMTALNIANRSMLSRYNKLLILPDEKWVEFDENDTAERAIRAWFDRDKAKPKWERNVARGQHLPQNDTSELHRPPLQPSDEGAALDNEHSGMQREPRRTVIGERMGLYDHENESPSPDAGRPTVDKYSPKEQWDMYEGIDYEERHEWGEDETWGEADEAAYFEALRASAGLDAVWPELDKTPFVDSNGLVKQIEALHLLAVALDMPVAKKTVWHWRHRSPESVRVWLHENRFDLDEYGADLMRELDAALSLLNAIQVQMEALMNEFYNQGEQIVEDA